MKNFAWLSKFSSKELAMFKKYFKKAYSKKQINYTKWVKYSLILSAVAIYANSDNKLFKEPLEKLNNMSDKFLKNIGWKPEPEAIVPTEHPLFNQMTAVMFFILLVMFVSVIIYFTCFSNRVSKVESNRQQPQQQKKHSPRKHSPRKRSPKRKPSSSSGVISSSTSIKDSNISRKPKKSPKKIKAAYASNSSSQISSTINNNSSRINNSQMSSSSIPGSSSQSDIGNSNSNRSRSSSVSGAKNGKK